MERKIVILSLRPFSYKKQRILNKNFQTQTVDKITSTRFIFLPWFFVFHFDHGKVLNILYIHCNLIYYIHSALGVTAVTCTGKWQYRHAFSHAVHTGKHQVYFTA